MHGIGKLNFKRVNDLSLIKHHLYTNIYIYMDTNLPLNAIVKLPYRQNRDSQGQEKFLAPSTDKQVRNYDRECSNHPFYQP